MEEIFDDTVNHWQSTETHTENHIYQSLFQPLYSLMRTEDVSNSFKSPTLNHPSTGEPSADMKIKRLLELVHEINKYITNQYNKIELDKLTIQTQNMQIFNDLTKEMSSIFRRDQISPHFILFGSRISGLSTKESDLDVALVLYQRKQKNNNKSVQRKQSRPQSRENLILLPLIGKSLEKQYLAEIEKKKEESKSFEEPFFMTGVQALKIIETYYKRPHESHLFALTEAVYRAKSPIIKVCHKKTGLPIDIGTDMVFAPQNTLLAYQYCQSDVRIHQLLLLIKQWASRRSINHGSQGFISSFSWCLVTIHFLLKFQEFFQTFPVKEENGRNYTEKLRMIFVPEYQWTDHGREIVRAYRNDLLKFYSFSEEDVEKELFQLVFPSTHTPATSSLPAITLDNSITTGELFIWFFVFYGTAPEEGWFSFDPTSEIRLTDETIDVIAGVSVEEMKEKDEKLKIFDPIQNIPLGRTIRSVDHRHYLTNEFRRNAMLVLNYISSTSSSSSSSASLSSLSNSKAVFDAMIAHSEPVYSSGYHSNKTDCEGISKHLN